MAVQIGASSRLRWHPLSTLSGVEFWDLAEYPPIEEQADDQVYTVRDADRLDTLANRYYGDPAHWWILAVANGMELVPVDLVVGAQIKVPSPRYVTQVYLAQSGV